MSTPDLFNDLLKELGVPHTQCFSRQSFESMTFKSWFGLAELLRSYGVESRGFSVGSLASMAAAPMPFLAATKDGSIIVTSIKDGKITYLTQGVAETMPADELNGAFAGQVLLFEKQHGAAEPGYGEHRRADFFAKAKKICLSAGAVFLFLYLFISNGIYRHASTILLTLFDIVGLYLTYMLMQKSLKINNPHADAVCRVLDEGGCDSILEMKASSFFGIFKWSEVGFAYFSVSLLCLLVFPQWTGYLALCNVCALPFTFWSIWYQKFRAKKWCTLCVSVQATLWLLFFCFWGGGFLREMFPLRIEFFVLGATYITVLLAINRLSPLIQNEE